MTRVVKKCTFQNFDTLVLTNVANNFLESPPITEAVAPPKKRRLPRESLSKDNSPPTTPTQTTAPPLPEDNNKSGGSEDGRVEIVYSGTDEGDSPTQVLESDAVLKERFVCCFVFVMTVTSSNFWVLQSGGDAAGICRFFAFA